ncbi:invasion associated locus B family protein [Rhodobacteraceae bacterium KN286]|uniref:Invasion associated locus B family protein n=2 Tax=Oceanomicrobium pacificus TaxID=2692916 RepID=A0A6B0TTY6_9RHOB|nr:invasion associated locus B family protein [Oceanomicrobium pacificus]
MAAGAALAQDADATADAPAAEAPAATGQVDPSQFPVGGTPTRPEEFVKAEHGEWDVRCIGSDTECALYQLAEDQAGNAVAEMTLIRLPEGQDVVAGVTIMTPLETLLPAGLTAQVDAQTPQRYEFQVCTQRGCAVRFGLDQAGIDAMKAGAKLNLVLFAFGRPDPVPLNVSLSGFTAAFNELTAPPAPQAAPEAAAPAIGSATGQ